MRLKLVVSTALAVAVSVFATGSWAQKGKKKDASQQEVVPDSINRQFQWEEKVVGPKDKGVDHKKIAALQEQGRREDEARKKEPPKKAQRAEGVDAPASSTLPTMDIEKPAVGVTKKPKKVAAEAPRQHDALDNILSQETGKSDGFSDRDKKGGLGAILASDDGSSTASARPAVRRSNKPQKRVHRRRN